MEEEIVKNEDMVDGEDVTRRDMLRKSAIGAGVGAAALAAPSISGLGVAPAFAAVGSPCTGSDGSVSLTVTNPLNGSAENLVLPIVASNGLSPDGPCTATVVIEALGINPDVPVDITGTATATSPDGTMTVVPIAGQFSSFSGGEVVVTVPCGCPVVVNDDLVATALFGGGVDVPISVTGAEAVTGC